MTDDGKPGERIAKIMARAGLCSRREAEAWIAAGRVAINGTKIASPAVNVTARDRVTVDGAPLPRAERTRLFLFNKPRGLVTTNADPEGRPTIFGALPQDLPRLISVGRLDLSTEGLLLLTNDGGLARVLELPETGWLRRYRVRAHGRVTQQQLDALRHGVTIDGIRYGAIEATLDRDQGANVWLTFAIREGKNREVRNVLEHLGLKVARLIRVSFGPFQLGELPPGATEEVKTRHLREQLGERIAKEAGCDFAAPVATPARARSETSQVSSPALSGPPSSPGRFPNSVVPHRTERDPGAARPGSSEGGRGNADASDSTRAPSSGREVYTRTGPPGPRKAPPDGRLRPDPDAGRRQSKDRRPSRQSDGPSGKMTQDHPRSRDGARGNAVASESTRAPSPGREVYTRTGPPGRRKAPPDGRLRPDPDAERRHPKGPRPPRPSDRPSGKFKQARPGSSASGRGNADASDSTRAPSPGRDVYTRAGPTGRRKAPPDGGLRPDPGAGRRPKGPRPPRQSDGPSGKFKQRVESEGKPPRKWGRDQAAPNQGLAKFGNAKRPHRQHATDRAATPRKPEDKPPRKPGRDQAAPDRAGKPRRPKTRYHGKRDPRA
jgi:23S rRNA pseudouridine2605 synthase